MVSASLRRRMKRRKGEELQRRNVICEFGITQTSTAKGIELTIIKLTHVFFVLESAPNKSRSNHFVRTGDDARFYVQSQKHLKAMKDGTNDAKKTTCQTCALT